MKPNKPRKKHPRGKGKRSNPAVSKLFKELWQDPEFRERMRIREENRRKLREANPDLFKRTGIPDGMTKAQAQRAWKRARKKADRFIEKMKEEGELPPIVVPGTDAEKAEKALHEACVLAFGPGERQTKMAAIRTILEWTKSKPESKSKVTVDNAEAWLAKVASDMKKPNAGTDSAQ